MAIGRQIGSPEMEQARMLWPRRIWSVYSQHETHASKHSPGWQLPCCKLRSKALGSRPVGSNGSVARSDAGDCNKDHPEIMQQSVPRQTLGFATIVGAA